MSEGDLNPERKGGLQRVDWGILLLLCISLLAITMGPALSPKKALLPYDPRLHRPFADNLDPETNRELLSQAAASFGDHLLQFLPFDRLTAAGLKQGEAPLWNPGPLCGVAHPAQGTSQVYYPPARLFIFGDPLYVTGILFLLHLLAGTAALAAWLSRLGLDRRAILGAALLWSLSGWAWTNLHHPMIYYAGSWLFLGLWGLQVLADKPGALRGCIGIGGAVALTLLAGFPQISILALGMMILYGLILAGEKYRHGGGKEAWSFAWPALTCILAGLLLAMPHLLAMTRQAALTDRPEATAALMRTYGLDPAHLLGFFMPELLAPLRGIPYPTLGEMHPSYPLLALVAKPAGVLGALNCKETWLYVGIFPLLLSAGALPLWRRPRIGLFWVIPGLGLLIALGTPLLVEIWACLPGGGVGDAKRLLYLLAPAGVVTAAFGLDRILRTKGPGPIWLTLASLCGLIGLVALGLGLFTADRTILEFWLSRVAPLFAEQLTALAGERPWWEVLCEHETGPVKAANVLATRTGLVRFGIGAIAAGGAGWLLRIRKPGFVLIGLALGFALTLCDLATTGRKMARPVPLANTRLKHEWQRLFPEAPAPDPLAPGRILRLEASPLRSNKPELLTPNLANLIGWEDTQGYVPLSPRRYQELFTGLDPGLSLSGAGVHSLSSPEMLGAPFISFLRPRLLLTDIALDKLTGWRKCGETKKGTRLYVNEDLQPYANLITRWHHHEPSQGAERIGLLTKSGLDLSREAVLETAPPAGMKPTTNPAPPKLLSRRPGKIVVSAYGPGLLALSEGWHPDWTVWGSSTNQAIPVNHAFLGTWLGPGKQEVTFTFTPTSHNHGLYLALVGLILFASLLARLWWVGRKSR